jgi:hypothetical protein
MYARCASPIWRLDDLSPCFQAEYVLCITPRELQLLTFVHSYLKTLLPVLACTISFVVLLAQLSRSKSKKRHDVLIDTDEDVAVFEDGEEDDSVASLALQKTYSRGNQSLKDVNRPGHEVFRVGSEFLLLLAQLAIAIIAILNTSGRSRRASIGELVVSAYLGVIATVRLISSTTKLESPVQGLWNHSLGLYIAQWLCQVWIFRSVLVHPPDRLLQSLSIASFAIISTLLVIAVTARKGNKGVVLEYEGDIEPSREPLASVFSQMTFLWVDRIVYRGYWKPLELSDIWNVAMQDKAEVVLSHFRQIRKTHSLALRLVIHFKSALLLQGAWCMLASVFMFIPTLLLKAILEYLENAENTPVSAAWLYVILLFASGAVQAVGDGQGLWLGRKICIQLRAIIVGEIYSKTLRRRAAASADAETEEKTTPKKTSVWTKMARLWRREKLAQNSSAGDDSSRDKQTPQANNGTIINLMSIDSFKGKQNLPLASWYSAGLTRIQWPKFVHICTSSGLLCRYS